MAQVQTNPLSAGQKNAAGALAPGAASSGRPGGGWKPIVLTEDFSLDDAVDKAMDRAARQMNWNLQPEGVVVQRTQAAAQRGMESIVEVAERETRNVLRTYDAPTFLGLYAAREKASGVVVDAQI